MLWTVDRSGLTSDTLSEVKRTGLLARLADEPDDGAAPQLTVAITKLDLIALDARRRYKRGGRPKFEEMLEQLRAEAVGMVKAQLREALRSASDDAQGRQRAFQRIAVVAVAPVEYRRFYLGDADEPPRITSPSPSGVPHLTRHLQTLAPRHRTRACRLFDELLAKQLATRPRRAARRRLEEIRQQLDQLRTPTPMH